MKKRTRHCYICKKVKADLCPGKRTCDDCLSVYIPCPDHSNCIYKHQKYTAQGKLRTLVPFHKAADELLPSGSTIHWSEFDSSMIVTGGGRSIPVTCGGCGKKRPLFISKIKYRQGSVSGYHVGCWGARSFRTNYGFTHQSNGYIYKHKNVCSQKEIEIASPMFSKNKHILEHRLIMAMHLGRPLGRDEMVHHLDSNRANNKIDNLRLLKFSQHHSGHGDDYYQPYQEALLSIRYLLGLLSSIKT